MLKPFCQFQRERIWKSAHLCSWYVRYAICRGVQDPLMWRVCLSPCRVFCKSSAHRPFLCVMPAQSQMLATQVLNQKEKEYFGPIFGPKSRFRSYSVPNPRSVFRTVSFVLGPLKFAERRLRGKKRSEDFRFQRFRPVKTVYCLCSWGLFIFIRIIQRKHHPVPLSLQIDFIRITATSAYNLDILSFSAPS